MRVQPLKLVFLGLSLSSSWGNGHATTYRALLAGLHRRGHDIVFLERDVPWYADNRDLEQPCFCRLALYSELAELEAKHAETIAAADAVIIGSFVPQGPAVIDLVLGIARGSIGFYDIDTPVTVARLDAADTEYLAAALIPRLGFYLSFSSGPILERIRRDFGAHLAVPFHCMVDPDQYRPLALKPVWDLGYLGTFSPDRQPALETLLIEPARRLPYRRFVVAGAQYPDAIDWPANVDRIPHIPPHGHAAFFGRLRFALNLTREKMRAAGYSPSVRLFETAACGTPALTDRWAGLDGFFPEGEAIVVADTPGDVITALLDIPEARRRRLGRAARKIVLAAHTGDKRAETLEGIIAAARRNSQPGIAKEADNVASATA